MVARMCGWNEPERVNVQSVEVKVDAALSFGPAMRSWGFANNSSLRPAAKRMGHLSGPRPTPPRGAPPVPRYLCPSSVRIKRLRHNWLPIKMPISNKAPMIPGP